MLCIVCDYAKISPAVLETMVLNTIQAVVNWTDLGEDCFEFRVYSTSEQIDLVHDLITSYAYWR